MTAGLGLIIVAAGRSTRMAGTDKVWASLDEHSVLWHAVANQATAADVVVVVVHSDYVQHAESALLPDFPHLSIVAGGVERHDSVRSGLRVLPDLDLIAVHDAARPLAAAALLQQGVRLLDRSDGAVPALPVADTVKEISLEHMVVRTLDRSALRSVQTPQVFRGDALRVAHELAHLRKGPVTDDASLVEDRGFRVIVFPGHPRAFKITTEYDLRLARLLVAAGGDS